MSAVPDRPAPLVPAEVDLRDFAFMPLDVVRLRDSGLTAKATGDEFRAAVLLWCASWHQVPAASLPDDDDELANICGYSRARREWAKVRGGAMRGWVACDDGRLYHAAVAGKALEAWIEKLASAIGGATGNSKRWKVEIDTAGLREQFGRAVERLKSIDPQSRTLRKKAVAVLTMPSLPESGADSPPDSPPDRKGQGQGQGLDTPIAPSAAGRACLALRAAGLAEVNPGHPTLLALLEAGATADELVALVPQALRKRDPFRWLLGAAQGQREDATQAAAGMARGPLKAAPPPPEPAWRTEQRAATTALAGRYAAKPATKPAAPAAEVIDATPRLVG